MADRFSQSPGQRNPFAITSVEGGMKASTFSRFGKLTLMSVVPCTRCNEKFTPKSEIIRLHNRSELTRLLCASCTKRDNDLMTASASLMVIKGGFPPTMDQVIQAFYERDEALPKEERDPFEEHRETYKNAPLSEQDIAHWINEKMFVMNRNNGQLECQIDRMLQDPERVLALGKDGIAGKRMAERRLVREELEKGIKKPPRLGG